MQLQLNHVAGREGVLREVREEQFVDDARTRDADRTLLRALRDAWPQPRDRACPPVPPESVDNQRDCAPSDGSRTLLGLIGGQV